jgi:hypothetical protein
LGREELQGLVAAGLMKLGLGVSVSATPAGRTWVEESESGNAPVASK